ncbi:ATP-binding protein [Sphaerisporangium krabiense]|uniref:Anti-sigma regulatory factor (Ser/Thr protein kinase) n=1 Tax=Sphaerisporangium krabiense TaxID=763782 RepID=A0A7W9DSI3_9ACTN|nr:ATP-binding protein [Sphaerisporangium krabiense]MBB5629586.1 anti-sigma regulatory factor (Ser/Thr protein kinase) [Sphaerisporangium krabiense]GII67244.1 ATP-binding protein [Sphaerisporangium krabiense]
MTSSPYGRTGSDSDRVLHLAGDPDAVARARRLVSSALGSGHPLHDDCVLLTSEIATNAVVHSDSGDGGTFTLSVSYSAEWVRIAVQDAGSLDPPFGWRPTSPLDTGGRGLLLLEALAHRWGFIREAGTNNVWFEMHVDLLEAAPVAPRGDQKSLRVAR